MTSPIAIRELIADVNADFDESTAMQTWRWLVPQTVTPLLLTALGDLFFSQGGEIIPFLDTARAQVLIVADNYESLRRRLKVDQEAVDTWFNPMFVSDLRSAGKALQSGECFSPVVPPIMGGEYSVENWQPTNWRAHFFAMGEIHKQLRSAPEGAPLTDYKFGKLS